MGVFLELRASRPDWKTLKGRLGEVRVRGERREKEKKGRTERVRGEKGERDGERGGKRK